MIRFNIPLFDDIHKEQLHAMCAVPPDFNTNKSPFSYFPIDALYTTGSGLSSAIVQHASNANQLLTISEDSDVIFTHWHLAVLLREFIALHQKKWLNKLSSLTLPSLQHLIDVDGELSPVTGLNSLLLNLYCAKHNITSNVWELSQSKEPDAIYLSSYIHKVSTAHGSNQIKKNQDYPHPFLFLDESDKYKQHVYAGVSIIPTGNSSDTFCQRSPFKQLGMPYTLSAWGAMLISKLGHFSEFKEATELAQKHLDLFMALLVCSSGFPKRYLYSHLDYCSLLNYSEYSICEILMVLSPMVDFCTTLMIDANKVDSHVSYFIEYSNPDIAQDTVPAKL